MEKQSLRTVWGVVLSTGTVLIVCNFVGGYFWLRPPTVFDFPDARVSYRTGGSTRTITFLVRDAKGRPIQGVRVASESFSGWTSYESTDDQGRAILEPAEGEVTAVEVDGRTVRFYHENQTRIEKEFLPDCDRGLIFNVELRIEDAEQSAADRSRN